MKIFNSWKAGVLLLFFAITWSSEAQSNKFKVALDAGHGGKDFGAVYGMHIEKDIALSVALKVGKILEKNQGVDVIYTRKTDVFIDLVERANIANRADANIFVSIHCNANKNTAADGTETYVMGVAKNASNLEAAKRENKVITLEKDYKEKYDGFDPSSPETLIGIELMQEEFLDNSISLASKVQDQFVSKFKRKNRGVKQAPYMVLHKAYMPRVLIEMGFISNQKEGAYLDSEEGQDDMAEAIAGAIMGYKKEFFGAGKSDAVSDKPSQRITEAERTVEPAVEEPKRTNPTTTPAVTNVEESKPAISTGVTFKVQISASSKNLPLTPSNFNGLAGVTNIKDGTLYKYYYGESRDYSSIKDRLAEAKSKGFSSAYVVAFKNGQRISLEEALK